MMELWTFLKATIQFFLGYDRHWERWDNPERQWVENGQPWMRYERFYPRLIKFKWGLWSIELDEANRRHLHFHLEPIISYQNGGRITGFSCLYEYESVIDGYVSAEVLFIPVDFDSKLLPWDMRGYKLPPSHHLYSFFQDGISELGEIERFCKLMAANFYKNLADPSKQQSIEFLEVWVPLLRSYQILTLNRWLMGHSEETLLPDYYLRRFTQHETKEDFITRVQIMRYLLKTALRYFRNFDNLDLREFHSSNPAHLDMNPVAYHTWNETDKKLYSYLEADANLRSRAQNFRQRP